MPVVFIIIMSVVAAIIITIPLVFIFAFWLPNYRSIIKRAKKIDPSVKTIAEAQYVLQKNIMESVGQNKTTEQNEKNKDKNL
ncbi:MAG: hypothetical protein KH405_00970 [Firmicutes bacterium]|nr:hypothetical protein [Bacillota bacterium]